MAEDYRAKYANLEREFNYLKHTHEYDLEKVRQDHMNVEGQLNERIKFEQTEAQARMQKTIQEKDEQIDNLIDDNRKLIAKFKEADHA